MSSAVQSNVSLCFPVVGDIIKVLLPLNVITCERNRKRKFQRLSVAYLVAVVVVVAGRKSAEPYWLVAWHTHKACKAQSETATNCLYVRAISIATTLIIIEFGRPFARRKEAALYGRGLTTSDHAQYSVESVCIYTTLPSPHTHVSPSTTPRP